MAGGTAGAVTGAVVGTLSNAGGIASGVYDFKTAPQQFQSTGRSTGNLATFQNKFIQIYRFYCPDLADELFTQHLGNACNFWEKLSKCTGMTVCSNPIVNIERATSEELSMIKTYLESGVIL